MGKELRRLRLSDDPKVLGDTWGFIVLALYFARYNFCRIHGTLRVTPAIGVGITSDVWMLDDLPKEAVLYWVHAILPHDGVFLDASSGAL